jgi:hypothetical protein
MNLVTILIPVLLMAIKSLELAIIDTTLPAIGAPTTVVQDKPENPPLELKLAVTNAGVRLLGADEFLADPEERFLPCKSSGPCRGLDDYSWGDLSERLLIIKNAAVEQGRDSSNVILIPESNLRYEILIKVMDVARNKPVEGEGATPITLFPHAVFAGGTNK